MRLYADILKPIVDKTIALLVLIIFSPLLLILMLLISLDFGENPFFRQQRTGKNCKFFDILKFKKMRPGNSPEDLRLTRLGRFIRRSSLDELPQFVNILKGQMSLIGPRPLLARYLPYYTPLERLRHCVKPGLTGWAQVHGRVTLDWETRFEYDLYYAKHIGLLMDLKIIFLTVKSVIHSFITPVDNPPALIKRFDQWRCFIRLPNKNDNRRDLLRFVSQHSKLEPEVLEELIFADYFDRSRHSRFLLFDDREGRYNSFAVFVNRQNPQMIDFFANTANAGELKQTYLNLAKLYARHFDILSTQYSGHFGKCKC